jgi:hypothetical protein
MLRVLCCPQEALEASTLVGLLALGGARLTPAELGGQAILVPGAAERPVARRRADTPLRPSRGRS